jgi:hypothetical protein
LRRRVNWKTGFSEATLSGPDLLQVALSCQIKLDSW